MYIKGVGPNRVESLNKLGIFTLKDLITYYPRDYEDRSKPKKIIDAIDGEDMLIEAIVVSRIVDNLIMLTSSESIALIALSVGSVQ